MMFWKTVSLGNQNWWHLARCFLSAIGLLTKSCTFPIRVPLNHNECPTSPFPIVGCLLTRNCCLLLSSPPIHSTAQSLWSKPRLMQSAQRDRKDLRTSSLHWQKGYVCNLACRKAEKMSPSPPPFPWSHSSLNCQPSTVSCSQLSWFLSLHPELWEQQEQQESHGQD